jgi:hypothetical protein
MGALRLSLIGATLLLACLDTFLATRLFLDRRHVQSETQERVELQRRVIALREEHRTAARAASSTTAPVPQNTGPATDAEKLVWEKRLASLKRDLRQLTDPETREAKLREQNGRAREYYAGLATELQLSSEESDLVFDVLAGQGVKHEARLLRKLIARGEPWVDEYSFDEETQKQLALALGPERLERFMAFRDRIPERRRLTGLQSRLVYDSLKQGELARLGDIMREERTRFTAEIDALGSGVRFETGYPEDARRHWGISRAGQLKFDEDQIERTAAHYARIRERAAEFLTPAQLQRLKQQQESRLASARRLLMQRRRVDLEVEALRQASAQP